MSCNHLWENQTMYIDLEGYKWMKEKCFDCGAETYFPQDSYIEKYKTARFTTDRKLYKEYSPEDKIRIKVDFYADGFRSGIIEVPKDLLNYGENERRVYVIQELIKRLPQDKKWDFHNIQIIIAKNL